MATRYRGAPPSLFGVLRLALCGFVFLTLLSSHARSQSLQLLSHLGLPGGGGITDVWGYVDDYGREYALVGNNWVGIQVVEVSNPFNPVLRTTVPNVPRQDIKSWQNYVYTVDGNLNLQGENGAILDFTDPLNPSVVGSFPPGHNVFIDEDGYLYVSYPGLKIFDLNPNPASPTLVWVDTLTEGHDACVVGGRLYNFSGPDGTFIYDVTTPWNPVKFGEITDPSITFHHSGWVSSDGDFLYLNDEMAVSPTPDITVWLVTYPWTIGKIGSYNDPNATVHNSFIMGDFLIAAYYTSGLRVLDATWPFTVALVDEYDTSPLTGEGLFQGAWGCYPFSPSGYIFVSDRSLGLYVFTMQQSTAIVPPAPDKDYELAQNHPNPFNPVTTIRFHLPSPQHVDLVVYDTFGREVRTLVAETRAGGDHYVQWDGRNNGGRPVASGVYFYRMRSGAFEQSKRLVLLK